MEARPPTSAPSLNPPSVEIAYKRKCIALKKRLAEVEAENELMRTRNRRGWQYIQKMRLESCMLLERLAKVTGMTEEAQAGAADPELRARAVAMMSNVASINGMSGGASGRNGPSLEDETEGSSDEQPPTVSNPNFRSFSPAIDLCPSLSFFVSLPCAIYSLVNPFGTVRSNENILFLHSPKTVPCASSAPASPTSPANKAKMTANPKIMPRNPPTPLRCPI
jgi:hypothetical protein